jgi:hypothetical protein
MRLQSLLLGLTILGFGFLYGCSFTQNSFTITNNSDLDRTDEPVVLTRTEIKEKTGGLQITEGYLPLVSVDGGTLPSQLDDVDGDGNWDELAFTLNIPNQSSVNVEIDYVTPDEYPEFTPRTNVRFGVVGENGIEAVETLNLSTEELPVPLFTRFQMDGPAWENDKIGFRQYIDGRNGRDLYGKRMTGMALDTVGISNENMPVDDYHVMLPWGRDILAVGNSLGLGGLAILENGEPVRLGVRMDAEKNNVGMTRYSLITEGPVRSIFKINYENWNTGSGIYDLENTVTIWAGRYGYENKVVLNSSQPSDTLIVGLVNIHNDNPPVLLDDVNSDYAAFYTHDKQTYDDEWFLGMGIIFPSTLYLNYEEAPESGPGITTTFMNHLVLKEDKSMTYHVVAGWELSDERFADPTYFRSFMHKEIRKKASPVLVE